MGLFNNSNKGYTLVKIIDESPDLIPQMVKMIALRIISEGYEKMVENENGKYTISALKKGAFGTKLVLKVELEPFHGNQTKFMAADMESGLRKVHLDKLALNAATEAAALMSAGNAKTAFSEGGQKSVGATFLGQHPNRSSKPKLGGNSAKGEW